MVPPMTRRDFLRATAGTAGLVAAASALGACSGDEAAPATSAGSGAPRAGGTLRVAIAGGGPAESLNPFTGASPLEFARNRVVWDVLFALDAGVPLPRLALSADPAPDGKAVTLRLRPGVRFHDGAPFGAQDVLFTLRTLTAPSQPFPSELGGYLDVPGATAVDEHTVRIPLRRPVGDPTMLLAVAQTAIVKAGTTSFDPATAVGTGPFRVTSFQSGRSSTVRRFDDHWDGAAYLDELTFLSLADPQARVNSVLSGQAELATAVPYTAARTVPVDGPVEVRSAGDSERTGFGIVLNTVKGPFRDPRVRRAARLAVDRRSLVDTVFLGYGVPGNDLFGAGARYFDDRQPLARDVDRARRLVEQAGAAGAQVVLRSAELESGVNASAQLIAQQLGEVGLRARPQVVGLAEFRDLEAMAGADGVTLSLGAYPLQTIYTRLVLVPSLGLADPQLTTALRTALASPREPERAAAWRTVQEVLQDRGNLVVWGFGDTLSLARRDVSGVRAWGAAKYPYLGKAWRA
jgi:peptide/nickel transport system substrate-binding protein